MRKITEILNGKSDKFVLTAFVDKESKELISINDSLIENVKDKSYYFDFELTKPNFVVLSEALKALYSTGGEVDTIRSGSIIFDACYVGNQGSLEEIKERAELYASLCAKCAEKVEIAHIEYKKK